MFFLVSRLDKEKDTVGVMSRMGRGSVYIPAVVDIVPFALSGEREYFYAV